MLGAAARVQRDLAQLPSAGGGTIVVRPYTIRGWRQVLQSADEPEVTRELNAFMALAVGHSVYERSSSAAARSMQQDRLTNLPPVPSDVARRLMVALLTVPNTSIDLAEASPSPLTGLLLRKFVSRYYASAIDQLAELAGPGGDVDAAQVDPADVAEFLQEAEESGRALRRLRARTEWTPQSPTRRIPSKLHEVGASDAGPRLVDELQAQALAGAHGAAASALATVYRNPDDANAQDVAGRQIARHSEVLRGIIERHDQIRAMNEAIIGNAVGVLFTAAGPLSGGLSLFKQIVIGGATEILKSATTSCASHLAGKSGEDVRGSAREAFSRGIQKLENGIEESSYGPFRPDVQERIDRGRQKMHELADDLKTELHMGTD